MRAARRDRLVDDRYTWYWLKVQDAIGMTLHIRCNRYDMQFLDEAFAAMRAARREARMKADTEAREKAAAEAAATGGQPAGPNPSALRGSPDGGPGAMVKGRTHSEPELPQLLPTPGRPHSSH